MSYVVRAFCTVDAVPTIRVLLKWLREEASFNAAVHDEGRAVLQTPKWKSFELTYDPDKESLLVECQRNTGPRSRCARDAKEELETLEGLEDSPARNRVAECLTRTRFIISCRVDRDPDHEEAFNVRSVLDYFVDHCGALLDVEDEGFYSCSDGPLLGRCTEE